MEGTSLGRWGDGRPYTVRWAPRLVLVCEPDQLGVKCKHPQLAFGGRLGELTEPHRHGRERRAALGIGAGEVVAVGH